jgi:hypothetical protein
MPTETISIPLDPQTARAYGAARAEEKLKMQALVGLWLRELTSNELPSLEQALDSCSALSSWRLTTSGSALANQASRLSSRLLMLLMLNVATLTSSLF